MMMINAALDRVFSTKLEPARMAEIIEQLSEPFDPSVVEFRVGPTKGKGREKTGKALVYAKTRAYWDRLNEVVGNGNWVTFAETVISPVMKRTKTKLDWSTKPPTETEIETETAKVIVHVSIGIIGVGFRTEVGEEWAESEMAVTSAYAQALKRACASIGLGRYLYAIEGGYYPVYGSTFEAPGPQLPDWALPPLKCVDGCRKKIVEGQNSKGQTFTPDQIVSKTREKFKKDLCFDCWRKLELELRDGASKKSAA